jgi:PAS domain S-box-containing protein
MSTARRDWLQKLLYSEFGSLVSISIIYYVIAQISSLFIAHPEDVSTIWPLSGLALAILLLNPTRRWPNILIVLFTINLSSNLLSGMPWMPSLGFGLTICAESLLAGWFMYKTCGENITFSRTREILMLAAATVFINGLTALLGAAISTIGFGASFGQTWLVWWIADGLGIFVVTPFIITWMRADNLFKLPRPMMAETTIVLTSIALITFLIYSAYGTVHLPYIHTYSVFPLLIWLALRLKPRHVTTGLLILTILSIWQTLYAGGAREFSDEPTNLQILLVQIFMVVATFTTLALHSVVMERQRTEEKLRESENGYARIISTSLEGIWVGGPDRQTTFSNTRLSEILGYSQEELLGKKLSSYIIEDDLPIMEEQARLRNQGKSSSYDIRFRQKNGSVVWCRISASPVFDTDGKFAGSFGMFSDITERKLEESVRAARLRLLEFAEHHSLDELLQNSLDEAEHLTGSKIGFYHFVDDDQISLTLQNWSTNTLKNMCTAEGKGLHYAIDEAGVWVDCVRAKAPVIHNDYASLSHRKGMPVGHAPVIRELVVPVMRGEKIVAILGVGNKEQEYTNKDIEMVNMLADLGWEITERKRAQTALQAANERMSATLDALPDLLFEIDQDYIINSFHAPNNSVLYRAPEEFLGKDFRQLLPENASQKIEQSVREAFEKGYSQGLVYFLEMPNGTRWFETTVARKGAAGNKKTSAVALVRDITERKNAEEQLERALSDKEALLRELYHRTKNNMQVISAMLALQADNLTDQRATQIFEDIGSKIQSMAIVHQMLYRSQNLDRIDLKEYIAALAELLISTYRERSNCNHIDIQAETISANIDIAIPCGLIVNELITNAFKYAFPSEHSGELVVKLESRPENHIYIEVSDNGVGFPPGLKVEETMTLGLQTVIALGEHQLQGKVKFQNNQGVTCQVEFPASFSRG